MSRDQPSPPAGHHQTLAEDRIPLREKSGYAAGGMSYTLMANGIGNMANFVLNVSLGVNPALVGLLLAIPRLFDALIDPFIGSLSDNHRSRWGRRKPFMVLGGLGAGLFFAALWWMPYGWSQMSYFWYFLIISLVYYTFTAFFSVPWGALGLSMTADYHERTRLMAFNTFMCAAVAVLLSWLYALIKLDVFKDTLTGARWVSAGVGLIMIGLALVSAVLCKEKQLTAAEHEAREPMMPQFKQALTNGSFLILAGIVLFMCLGIFSIASLTPYIAIYYIHSGDEKAAASLIGWGGTVWQVGSLLFVALVSMVATRIGKRHTLALALGCALFGNLIKWFCYTPAQPVLFLIPPLFIALGFCALWTLTSSMMADVCDLHELRTGGRSEGVLNAMYAWLTKLGTTAAFAVSGVVLNLTGFQQSLGAMQPGKTIFLMRIADAAIPAAAILIAIVLTLLYPVSENRAYQIREELERRRGKLDTVD